MIYLFLCFMKVYLGEQYVNNPKLSDVTFIVEGKEAAANFCYCFLLIFLLYAYCIRYMY
jgi:hypothetical protein